MGIGPNYRRNNPYTHSDASYNSMADGYKTQIEELKKQIAKNPDPSNFVIIDVFEAEKFTVLNVKYPNCTNLEGNKILVVRGSAVDILKRRTLDPHFSKDGFVVARFEPTDKGWAWACDFAQTIPT